jgi:hypothetical protein
MRERRPMMRGGDFMDRRGGDPMHMSHKERILKEGRCFTCGDKGHISRECPKQNRPGPNRFEN